MSFHYYTRHAKGKRWVCVPKKQYERLMKRAEKGKEHRLFATVPRDKEAEFLDAYGAGPGTEVSGYLQYGAAGVGKTAIGFQPPKPVGHLMFAKPTDSPAVWLEVWEGSYSRYSKYVAVPTPKNINLAVVACVYWMNSHGMVWDELVPNLETKRVFVSYDLHRHQIYVTSADISGLPPIATFTVASPNDYNHRAKAVAVVMQWVEEHNYLWDGKVENVWLP